MDLFIKKYKMLMNKSILISISFLLIISSGCIRKNEANKTKLQDTVQTKQLQNPLEIDEILFVGMIGNKAGLFKYDFSTNSHFEFWKNEKEEVVELSYSPNKKSVFLTTAVQSDKKGVFPFIDNVKLYSVNVNSGLVKFLENIGSGLQVFSFWENDSSFKVILNIMDVTVGKSVDQIRRTYNNSGKKLSEEKKKYDLAKLGYPQFPTIQKKLVSTDKKYSIMTVDSAQTFIYLIDPIKNNEKTLITNSNQKLNFVDWSNDGKFLFFSTLDISPGNETLYDEEPSTAKLFIFSLEDKKIVKVFEGGGIKNFLLNGDLLLFDDGFKDKAELLIFNFRAGKLIDNIKISGGCGLKRIPSIPDYGA
jgi:hypothetical protein